MKKITFLFVLFTFAAFAQKNTFQLSGKIISKTDKSPLESATVHIERVKDSAVISYTITTEDGKFDLSGKTFYKDIRMVVSYVGMKSYQQKIPFKKLSNFNVGIVDLEDENTLEEVIIRSSAPITVKKDTLEFNVKSFKTKKNANVEDLLKKLPGVEVDAEGKITVNGKSVNNILVNGKPFFGSDASIATKNLSKEIIQKVQITDTKTKSEAFTGEKGDDNNKTINLTIKKENNKGWFGRVAGGVGTRKHYEGALMVNRFSDKRQISVLAGGNNINSAGFSFGEIRKMFGSPSSVNFSRNGGFSYGGLSFGMGEGLIASRNIGAAFNDELKKGIDLSINYFHSGSSSNNITKSNREYTLTDNNYFTESNAVANSENYNHSVKLGFDIKADPTLLINIKPTFSFSKQNAISSTNQQSLNNDKELINKFYRKSMTDATVKNFKNSIDITKKIDTTGSFVKVVIDNEFNRKNSEDYNKSTIETSGLNSLIEDRNQKSDGDNKLIGFGSTFTYRYPIISKKFFIDARYTYQSEKQQNEKSTYDFNPLELGFSDFNSLLSSDYNFQDITKTPFVEAIYKAKKIQLNIGSGYDMRTLKNEDFLRPAFNFSRNFNNFNFKAGGRYTFKSKLRLSLNYSAINLTPQLYQLQSFTDVSNPSNIRVGNPNLKPSRNHQTYLNVSKFNWQKRTGIFAYANVTYRENAIVNNTSIDNNLIRRTTYENLDGAYRFYGGGSYRYGVKLDSVSNLKISLGLYARGDRNLSVFNNTINKIKTNSLTPRLNFTYNWNKKINIEPSYSASFHDTKYDVNTRQNRKFTTHSLSVKTRTNIPKKLEWENDIRYSYNPNLIGFEKSSLFWNTTFSYSVLKDKGAITFKVYDLLNQNTNAKRIATDNYIEDQESTVLQRYFMLGFSWKFNTMGAKGKTGGDSFIRW